MNSAILKSHSVSIYTVSCRDSINSGIVFDPIKEWQARNYEVDPKSRTVSVMPMLLPRSSSSMPTTYAASSRAFYSKNHPHHNRNPIVSCLAKGLSPYQNGADHPSRCLSAKHQQALAQRHACRSLHKTLLEYATASLM